MTIHDIHRLRKRTLLNALIHTVVTINQYKELLEYWETQRKLCIGTSDEDCTGYYKYIQTQIEETKQVVDSLTNMKWYKRQWLYIKDYYEIYQDYKKGERNR